MVSIWFSNPGGNHFAPILTIFILESTILDDNGFMRIARPLFFTSLVLIFTVFFLWKKNSKN
mgnify:CR=1 FL=1